MICPKCGKIMTEYELEKHGECTDCANDVWAAKIIGKDVQSEEQIKNMIDIFKEMRRKEHDEYIKQSYNGAINSYKKQLKERKKNRG